MLYTDIRKLQKLDAKRSPMFDKNRFAKFLMYFAVAFWAAYLIFFGVMLSFAFEEDSPNMEPYHVLNQGLIIFLILDFLIRFLFPTPVQAIKPFLLLPVPKRKIMSILLIDSGLSLFNLFWLFFFVPFALITVTRFYGLTGVIGYALGIWLLMVFNSYWSMLIKVLIRQKFLNILWVVPVYGILALIEFLPETGWLSTFTMNLGEAFILWNPLSYLGELAAIFLMAYINYRVQLKLIHNELSRKEDTHVRHISSYSFFDRYGNVGEYMRLELKMLFRNKSPKSQFWMLMAYVVMFAAFLTFNVYGENSLMNDFMCLYCYIVFGIMTLIQVMAIEGNYIDGLMVRKESIYNMLRAKYYLQCIFLLIPFLLCLVPVIKGSMSLLMSLSYLFFTMGPVFACLMQMAVYNDRTMPLNVSMIGKRQNNNKYQSIVSIAAMTVPLLINRVLTALFEPDTAYIIMILLGLAGFLTHRYWIYNIYKRFMKRRYQNMENFRNTR